MGWFIRRPRIMRKPRIVPRSVKVLPGVRVSKKRITASFGPVGYSERRKRRS